MKTNKRNRSRSIHHNLPTSGFSWFIAGAAFGSIMSFLFDPVRGNYRRSLIRDKAVSLKRNTKFYGGKLGRDLANRAQGVKSNLQRLGKQEEAVSDETLIERVRSEFGRIISHPKAIDVDAEDGVVTLSGQILKSEVKGLISCVKKVRGVQDVINDLEAFEADNKIPSLQGKGPEYLNS